jgi:hypothetical protein
MAFKELKLNPIFRMEIFEMEKSNCPVYSQRIQILVE